MAFWARRRGLAPVNSALDIHCVLNYKSVIRMFLITSEISQYFQFGEVDFDFASVVSFNLQRLTRCLEGRQGVAAH